MNIKKWTRGIAASALAVSALLSLQGCSVNVRPVKSTAKELTVVGTVGGHEVYYDEFRYALLNTKSEMSGEYGEDIWTGDKSAEYEDELRERTYRAIENDYHAVYSMADYYYLGGSAAMFAETAVKEAVKKSVNETAAGCGSRRKYIRTLKENFLTDRLFRYFTACEECANELMFVLRNDLGVIADDKDSMLEFMHSDSFIRTNHVYIQGISEENEALAESVRRQLSGSTDVLTDIVILKGKYCSDFMLTTIHGNYFARYASDYGDKYEEIAFSLSVGETGEVLKTPTGYYVIVRLPLEEDYVEEKYADFHDMIVSSQFNTELEKFRSGLRFDPNGYCSEISLLTVK